MAASLATACHRPAGGPSSIARAGALPPHHGQGMSGGGLRAPGAQAAGSVPNLVGAARGEPATSRPRPCGTAAAGVADSREALWPPCLWNSSSWEPSEVQALEAVAVGADSCGCLSSSLHAAHAAMRSGPQARPLAARLAQAACYALGRPRHAPAACSAPSRRAARPARLQAEPHCTAPRCDAHSLPSALPSAANCRGRAGACCGCAARKSSHIPRVQGPARGGPGRFD